MLFCCCAATMAQSSTQPAKKSAARVTVDSKKTAPQVVTIVHRLNGLKLFRVLLRSETQAMALAGLDADFKLLEDVHTNVIAGVAMDDGETIAAWLPEADIELGVSDFQNLSSPDMPATPEVPSVPSVPSIPSGTSANPWGGFRANFLAPPDVTVIGADGKPIVAKYIGFDAVTGLSILKLADKNPSAAGTITDEPVDVGENVRLFGPEPINGQRGLLNSGLYVRVTATAAKVMDVQAAPTGGISRFRVTSPRLSVSIVGGVAINDAGETLGIVNGLEGGEASVLPSAMIRRAAQRVLERQASVPKPYLGVRGEAVAELKVDQMLNHGWKPDRAAALAYDHRGILVTSVIPGSPAEQAALKAGDVILKVNDWQIENGADFTWYLEQAGPSSKVSFTVARPDSTVDAAFDVKLSGMYFQKPSFKFGLHRRSARGSSESEVSEPFLSLMDQGIETITLRAPVASQLGTTAGLLVVYVEPATAAFEAGLQPGDVIRSINGEAVSRRPFLSSTIQPATYTFEVMRNKQKRTVTVKSPAKKKQ